MSFSDPHPSEDAEGRRLLLTAFDTAPVNDSPGGRAAFDGDLLRSVRGQDRRRRVRITFIGATAAVAAAALAVAGAVVLPSSSARSKAVPVTIGSVSYSFDTTASGTSPAIVLDAAAVAIGSAAGAGSGTEPNVDWGGTPYYHTVSVGTCGSGTRTNVTWIGRNGNGAGLTIDSKPGSDPGCGGAGGQTRFPIITGYADFYQLGNQPLTEAQVDELPTDPNKLWPILEGFDGDSLTSDPASPYSNASIMFQSIWNMITSKPLSAAFREALVEDAAKIPGVTVEGQYTDSLGRTGTVLHVGLWTMAIDTSDGQVLAMSSGTAAAIPICHGGKIPAGATICQSGASTTVYVSATTVASLPRAEAATLAKANALAKASGTRVAPAAAPTGGRAMP